jgi:peptidoglycan/LPS O-acetylase OafA/YrhL
MLLVLGAHGLYDLVPGGFIGVEMFFALSGYLITTLLLREFAATGRIRFGRFYLRRIRRLYPAMLAALVVAGVFWWATPPEAGRFSFPLSALVALSFTANFVRGQIGSLGHLWTLAIEEQFYLVWPGLLALALYTRRRWAVFVLPIAVGLASAILRGLLSRHASPQSLMPFTPARLDGLMAGALLAALLNGRVSPVPPRLAGPLLAVIGVLAALVSLRVHWVDPWLFRWGFGLIGVLAAVTVMLLVENRPGTLPARLLALPPLTWLGIRSYAIYLYHVPIFIATQHFVPAHNLGLAVAVFVARSALVFALAALSYRYLERPFLLGRTTPASRLPAAA